MGKFFSIGNLARFSPSTSTCPLLQYVLSMYRECTHQIPCLGAEAFEWNEAGAPFFCHCSESV